MILIHEHRDSDRDKHEERHANADSQVSYGSSQMVDSGSTSHSSARSPQPQFYPDSFLHSFFQLLYEDLSQEQFDQNKSKSSLLQFEG